MSQLGCVGSGNRYGEERRVLGAREKGRQRGHAWRKENGEGTVCSRERAHTVSSILRVFIHSLKEGVLGGLRLVLLLSWAWSCNPAEA